MATNDLSPKPPPASGPDLTELLAEVAGGNELASDQLLGLIYDELKRQARRFMRRERNRITLQTTALVHDAYLMLVKQHDTRWVNRDHFFAHAAKAMRRLLIDHARARNAQKRGGKQTHEPLDEALPAFSGIQNRELLALDDALISLDVRDPIMAKYVELRFFGGMTHGEAAAFIHMHVRTASREWQFTRAFLVREIKGSRQ